MLERIEQVLAGELRIVAAGAVASMKSTMLELLLGRPGRLLVGSGAVTAAPTYLRLTPGNDLTVGTSQVRMLTEAGARRRAYALLDITEDDHRSLDELSRMAHDNRGLVEQMAAAARTFELGQTYDLDEYRQLGGLSIGALGASLVERVSVDVVVPPTVWNLDWATGRTVVLIDLPGTGEGRVLENLVSAQHQAVAHLALNVVAVGAGTGFTPPRVHPESDCVLVATKLDHVEKPASNELAVLEAAFGAVLRGWRQSGRTARVAAISGAWACPTQESWLAFDAENDQIWDTANSSRRRWADAVWDVDGPTGGELREAVTAALRDGGVERLHRLIEELTTADQERVDEVELTRLVEKALALIDEATGAGSRPQIPIDRVIDRVDLDPQPVDELRRIARETAEDAVYGLSVWDETTIRSFKVSGEWRGTMPDVRQLFAGTDIEELTATAIEEVREQLDTALTTWAGGYSVPTPPTAGLTVEPAADAARGFGELGGWLLDVLVNGQAASGVITAAGERISLRWLARGRLELAGLLERRLVEMFNPFVEQVRLAVTDTLKARLSDQVGGGTTASLRAARRQLMTLLPVGSER